MTQFLDLFTPIQKGDFGLTDAAMYKSIQGGGQFIPVYGGTEEHIPDRFVSEYGKTKYDEPVTIFYGEGIVISLDGSAGCMTYVKPHRFALNHHAGFFKLLEQPKQLIILEFFSLFYEKQLQEASISEGSKTLTLATLKSLDFNFPKYDIQQNIMSKIKPILEVNRKVKNLIIKISGINEREFSIEYSKYQVTNIPVSEVLSCFGGNTGLTEREIYQKVFIEGRKYKVLSASTSEDTQLGYVPKFYLNGKELKVLEDKEGILVIRKGKAGNTIYYGRGQFTLTDDAYFLTVNDSCPYQVNLKWLMYQYRQSFFDYSSSSDNGTWNMTGFFKETLIDIPSYEEQLNIVNKYERLELLQSKMEGIQSKINLVFERQIVS